MNVNLGGLGVMIAEAVVEGVAGSGSVFTAAGRILDGHETTNYTLSRVAKVNSALSRPSTCLVSKWSAMRLDTPDCRRRLNARPNVPLGDEIDHYLGQGRGVARVTKEEEKQRIHPIGQ